MHLKYYIIFFICNFFLLKSEILSINIDEVIAKDRTIYIPYASIGSILENSIMSVIFNPLETGGLSRIETPFFFNRGISWREQNYSINNIDITDPLNSGKPLLEPPLVAINKIQISSIQQSSPYKPGLDYNIKIPLYNGYLTLFNTTHTIDGEQLIPKKIYKPAYNPENQVQSRRFNFFYEETKVFSSSNIFCVSESILSSRLFPTLHRSEFLGIDKSERIRKNTITIYIKKELLFLPYNLLIIGQYLKNNNYGAEDRYDWDKTFNNKSFSLHIGYKSFFTLLAKKFNIYSGITIKGENIESHIYQAEKIELNNTALRQIYPGIYNRINIDNNADYGFGIFRIQAKLQILGSIFKREIPLLQTINTYKNQVYSIILWENNKPCSEWIINSMINLDLTKNWGFFTLYSSLYIDFSDGFTQNQNILTYLGIGGRLAAEFKIPKSKTELYIGFLHQPAKMISDVISFLDNTRSSGKVYRMDNVELDYLLNNEIKSSNLSLYSTTGGKYHYKDNHLTRPFQDEIFISIKQKISKYFSIVLQGLHRMFLNYYIVNYENYNGTYSEIQGFNIYNKPKEKDTYYLSNNKTINHYSGIELELNFKYKKIYLKFSGSAYLVIGYAPPGNGPYYNDYAFISEKTASPNSRINAIGRLSSDRAYLLNLQFLYKITKNLSIGLTGKYRDGEPFSQNQIITIGNYPIKVMSEKRGDWGNANYGRYSCSINFDIRLRYTTQIQKKYPITIILDIYNLLGTAVEIIETYELGKRDPLESEPPRMIKIGAEIKY